MASSYVHDILGFLRGLDKDLQHLYHVNTTPSAAQTVLAGTPGKRIIIYDILVSMGNEASSFKTLELLQDSTILLALRCPGTTSREWQISFPQRGWSLAVGAALNSRHSTGFSGESNVTIRYKVE